MNQNFGVSKSAKQVTESARNITESARSWSPAASASVCSSLFNNPASIRMNVVFPVPFSPTDQKSSHTVDVRHTY